MSALTEIEAAAVAEHVAVYVPRQRRAGSGSRVRRASRADSAPVVIELHRAGQPRSSSMAAPLSGAAPRPGDLRPGPAAGPATMPRPDASLTGAVRPAAPLRLTRRGRIVVSGLIVIAATVAALLVTLLASAGAQATNHGKAGGAYAGMREVVVQPGQTLWSIASAAEPSQDPRAVIAQIMSVNGLTSTNIPAGEEIWVPR